jgi:hypothetical protein
MKTSVRVCLFLCTAMMMRVEFALSMLVAFVFCSGICYAQTIPPGVGSRQYGAKLAKKNDVMHNPAINGSLLEPAPRLPIPFASWPRWIQATQDKAPILIVMTLKTQLH